MHALLLVAILGVQEGPKTASVGKAEAAPYRDAMRKYREALEALDRRDLVRAEEVFTGIIENSYITRGECLLKLQNSDSTWNTAQEFFPRLGRARTRLAVAQAAFDRKDVKTAFDQLMLARQDADISTAAKVPGAPEAAKEIDDLLAKIAWRMPDSDGAIEVPRSHEGRYRRAVDQIKEAEVALTAGDAERALRLCTEVLEDPEILHTLAERTLLLPRENRKEKVDFRPFSVRARAAAARASHLVAQGKHADAAKLADLALAEFRRLGDENAARDARALLDRCAAPPPLKPEPPKSPPPAPAPSGRSVPWTMILLSATGALAAAVAVVFVRRPR